MRRELFVPRAALEFEQAAVRLAADRPQAAEAFLAAALTAARRLATNPGLGSSRAYVPQRYHFWPLVRFNYLLVYDATREPIQILRVVHTARDLPRLLSDLKS
ncbi:type II toxin-antitoxin system RelE/ParE family toxin [Roseomonas mucosa]|uniref:type II toxin-antitoxin system RelE/ParE family toxin n=1 Tax=Roseomonas mucosa TaxID=207340 RepID=UPI001D3F656E|nr:type II toxin-antitoxin system RelE/ParE family toxin [Acetobacteraceae bacterium]